jgi:class 3 adenylate cyclase
MGECPECGTSAVGSPKFCPECGAKLGAANAVTEVRKTVTVVFCDVVGSTALGERLDPEAQRGVMTRYFAEMQRVLELHGGRVEKFIGDAVTAVFGVPLVNEDDALRAARAAIGMLTALQELNRELRTAYGVELSARVGVNTGEVVVGDGSRGTVATGDAVNTAARLEQAAAPGEVLLGEATYRLIRDLVQAESAEPVTAKGKADPVRAWRLLGVPEGTTRPDGVAGHDAPLVGRQREVRLLREAFDRVVEERLCQLVTVLGVAGSGKTRLVDEFLLALRSDALVLRGRCLSYGEGVGLWPLGEILRCATGMQGGESEADGRRLLADLLPDEDGGAALVDLLAPLAGLGGRVVGAEDTLPAVRRFVEILARQRPVVLVVDDIHWAEPVLLDLLEHLVDLSRDVPVLLVCIGRPELLELRQGWAAGALNAASLHLSPLPDQDATQLVGELLAGAPVDPEVSATICRAAGGNPLFVEQLVAMLRDAGRVELADGVWTITGALDRLDLPPSVSALLAARLDRLPGSERRLLEAASVVGTVFYAGALPVLLEDDAAVPHAELTNLIRRDLIRRSDSDIKGEDGYRFLHVLVREAAYTALSKATRARMHERFADWLDDHSGRAVGELDEFVGYHLDQAYRLRGELGPVDDAARALADRAAPRLEAAGQRVLLVDPSASAALLQRAAALVTDDYRRIGLHIDSARALYEAGQLMAARNLLEEARSSAQAAGAEILEATATLTSVYVGGQIGEYLGLDRVAAMCDEAERRFPVDEHFELRLAIANARIQVFNLRANWAPILELTADAARDARAVADYGREHHFLQYHLAGLVHGPVPAAEALRRYTAVMAAATPAVRDRLTRLGHQAFLFALNDQPEDARAAARQALDLGEQAPGHIWQPIADVNAAEVELVLGDRAAGFHFYSRAVKWLEDKGERAWLSTYGPVFALNFLDEIGVAEATRLLEIARSAMDPDDADSHAMVHLLDALLHSRAGDHDAAVRLARAGAGWADGTDEFFEDAVVHRAVAAVLAAAGDPAGEIESLRRALSLFEAKGDLPDTRRIRAILTERESAPAAPSA